MPAVVEDVAEVPTAARHSTSVRVMPDAVVVASMTALSNGF